mgnify:CR=1 FL=1
MKKLFILIFAVTFTACNAPVEEIGAGFFTAQPGEKYVIGSDEVTDVWVNYIDAHNNRDYEAIMSLNSDSISVTAPDGTKIMGKQAHNNFLKGWFQASEPKWEIYWAMPYKAVTKDESWVIAGHWVDLVENGEEVRKAQMIDARIVDGLVDLFYVYQLDVPSESSAE